ncbi:MAG: hypothetical protein NTW49_11095 [Bacteroidia bacterium]|nr:hypothetical protein [Bacteroidia bacterium]
MKTKRIIVFSLGLLLVIPLFNGCRRGANDPWISFRSRNSRLSAVWSLESGYINILNNFEDQFVWNDATHCPNATGVDVHDYNDVKTYTYDFSNMLVSYDQKYTTTRDIVSVTTSTGTVNYNGHDWEDANTKSSSINYSLELTIKTNGTYRVFITYNVTEYKYPQLPDNAGNAQWGKTFSGTYEYVDDWHWLDDGLGSKSCVQFNGFPSLNVDIAARYKPDNTFDFNYINDITFTNQVTIFSIDQLANKNLTLISEADENGYYKQEDPSTGIDYYLPDGTKVSCIGTLTYTTSNTNKQHMEFTSDGKNVDQ